MLWLGRLVKQVEGSWQESLSDMRYLMWNQQWNNHQNCTWFKLLVFFFLSVFCVFLSSVQRESTVSVCKNSPSVVFLHSSWVSAFDCHIDMACLMLNSSLQMLMNVWTEHCAAVMGSVKIWMAPIAVSVTRGIRMHRMGKVVQVSFYT